MRSPAARKAPSRLPRTARTLTALSLLFGLLLTGCGRTQTPTLLTVGTADRGGTMAPAGSAIAAALSDGETRKVSVTVSNGSSMNVRNLVEGDIDLGLVSGDVAHAAYEGLGEFDGQPQPLRAIAAVYSSVSCWIASDTVSAEYVHDLTGLRLGVRPSVRLGVGPEGSTTELSAQAVVESLNLEDQGVSLVNGSLEDGVRQLADGSLDALHAFAGFPCPSLSQLAEEKPCHLLRLTEEELAAVLEQNPSYFTVVIPAGTYAGQDEDLTTFGAKCVLCVREDTPEELVYALTKTLYHAAADLAENNPILSEMSQPLFLCRNLPLPLHTGAERFYREEGLLEEE